MGVIRDRGRKADPEKLRFVLQCRYGSKSFTRFADLMVVKKSTFMPNGKRERLPGRDTILKFCRGDETDVRATWVPLMNELNVTFEIIEIGRGSTLSESVLDNSARLIEFPHVRTSDALIDLLKPQSYSHETMTQLRLLLESAAKPKDILNLSASVILDSWNIEPTVVGLLCILLGTNRESWHPTRAELKKLESLCKQALNHGHLHFIHWVEPLAFSLARHERPDTHRQFLQLAIEDEHWREANAVHTSGQYFRNQGVEISAIDGHLRDRHRRGLLQAHDAPPLMHLLSLPNLDLWRPITRNKLIDMLKKTAIVLRKNGEDRLRLNVEKFLKDCSKAESPGASVDSMSVAIK